MSRLIGMTAALAVTIATLFLLGGAAAQGVTATTTYTIEFIEKGLPSGTSWSVVYNGVTLSSTSSTISFSGLSAGSYYWYSTNPVAGTTGVEYTASTASGYVSPPYELSQYVVYEKQYQENFAVTPSGSGSVSPGGSPWYFAGESSAVSAIAQPGYVFSDWTSSAKTVTFGAKAISSTNFTAAATSTITAHFKATKYKITYTEVGLPASTTWSIVSGGTTYYSSTTTLTASTASAGYLPWSISPVSTGTGVQYSPGVTSGNIYVPYQLTQSFVFVEQFEVTIAASPASTGSVYPSGTAYYNAGSNISVYSEDSGSYVFSSWGVSNAANLGLGSKTDAGTNVTVRGPGTVTGKFVSGTPCTTCTVTIYEVGLPVGTTWELESNSQYYYSTVSASTTSMTFTGLTTQYFYFQVPEYTSSSSNSGSQSTYVAPVSSGSLYVPYELGYAILFTKSYYLTVSEGTSNAASTLTPYPGGWYPAGSSVVISTSGSAYYSFSKWTSNSTAGALASATSESTSVLLKGPATVTVYFVQPLETLNFSEVGLPSGTTWGVTFNGVFYGSSGTSILLHAIPSGDWSWSTGPIAGSSSGTQWGPLTYTYGSYDSGGIEVPYQSHQAVVYYKEYSVDITNTGGSGGSTTPSGTTWYLGGWILALSADNATSATFSSWSGSPSGSFGFGSTSLAATYVTISGAGTITCTFT